MGYSEKRRSTRLDTNNFISYYLLVEGKIIYRENFGKAKDISDYGLLMETVSIVEADYVLVMAADEKSNTIAMKGRVCHSKKDQNGVFYTGIEFVGDDERKSKFAKHLKRTHQMLQCSSILSVLF
jgi:hypothetical protein